MKYIFLKQIQNFNLHVLCFNCLGPSYIKALRLIFPFSDYETVKNTCKKMKLISTILNQRKMLNTIKLYEKVFQIALQILSDERNCLHIDFCLKLSKHNTI